MILNKLVFQIMIFQKLLFSINLPNFLTLNYILYSCLSMPSIDLSNFGFQNIITIERLLKLVNILKILI